MTLPSHTAPGSISQAATPKHLLRQFMTKISLLFNALPRRIHRRKIALPLGMVWRLGAILFVLIQHAERTGGDAEMLRQARSIHAELQRRQDRSSTVRSRPISSDISPIA
ncbi:MAG: hypothetical protein M3R24_35650 [Chloroflexota bacterium]|nr:hypothetical protein [Chloroflexota bacterium]